MKKPLDLARVEVHRHHPATPRRRQQVGDELGGDWRPGCHFAVLPGVAVVRDNGRDRTRRRTLQGVGHDEQLHQVVVHRRTRGLHQVDVDTADVLLNLREHLAVGETVDAGSPEGDLEVLGDRLGQAAVGVAGEDADRLEHHPPQRKAKDRSGGFTSGETRGVSRSPRGCQPWVPGRPRSSRGRPAAGQLSGPLALL